MSLTLPFDTLAYVKQLKSADVSEKQAKARAEALRAGMGGMFIVATGTIITAPRLFK